MEDGTCAIYMHWRQLEMQHIASFDFYLVCVGEVSCRPGTLCLLGMVFLEDASYSSLPPG